MQPTRGGAGGRARQRARAGPARRYRSPRCAPAARRGARARRRIRIGPPPTRPSGAAPNPPDGARLRGPGSCASETTPGTAQPAPAPPPAAVAGRSGRPGRRPRAAPCGASAAPAAACPPGSGRDPPPIFVRTRKVRTRCAPLRIPARARVRRVRLRPGNPTSACQPASRMAGSSSSRFCCAPPRSLNWSSSSSFIRARPAPESKNTPAARASTSAGRRMPSAPSGRPRSRASTCRRTSAAHSRAAARRIATLSQISAARPATPVSTSRLRYMLSATTGLPR